LKISIVLPTCFSKGIDIFPSCLFLHEQAGSVFSTLRKCRKFLVLIVHVFDHVFVSLAPPTIIAMLEAVFLPFQSLFLRDLDRFSVNYFSLPLPPPIPQENIRRAKKDWELTHLQSLRAAEERLAEEEAEDVLLTYDRPETANKVILRRRPSTGTWEILSRPPDLDLAPGDLEERGRHRGKRAGSRGSRRKRTSAVSESASSCIGSVAVASSSSLDAGAVYSADRLDNGTVNEQESPLPLVNHHDRGGSDERSMSSHDQVVDREIESHDESHDQQLKSRDLGIESHDRPDGSDVGSHDQSLTPKSNGLRGETESLTPPRLSSEEKQLNFPAPLLLGTPLKSEPPSPLLATPPRSSRNPSEVDTDSISSRTRQRQASLSLSDLNLSSSSSSSPSHKYPTRHRLSLN
jgi:hypothetical protein